MRWRSHESACHVSCSRATRRTFSRIKKQKEQAAAENVSRNLEFEENLRKGAEKDLFRRDAMTVM